MAEIEREHIIPDVELCNALIRVGSRAEGGRVLVSKVLALMRKYRLEYTAETHHTLIAAYALLKEPKLALATFEDMKQRVPVIFIPLLCK
jgi:pentatricopeptide repeat protein